MPYRRAKRKLPQHVESHGRDKSLIDGCLQKTRENREFAAN
jgi:hypothetical protein